MKPMPKVKTVTLQEYNAQHGSDAAAPLYVLNQSSESADIIMNAIGDNGRNIAIVLPFSFAPLDITAYAPRANLIGSAEFRRLLQMRVLCIIDNESAETALKDPRVAKELSRIFAANTGGDSGQATGSTIELGSNRVTEEEEVVTERDDINPLADQILGVATEEADSDEVQNAFIRNLTRLKKTDLEYLRRESKNRTLTDLVVAELDSM